jgi:hypothetical protein
MSLYCMHDLPGVTTTASHEKSAWLPELGAIAPGAPALAHHGSASLGRPPLRGCWLPVRVECKQKHSARRRRHMGDGQEMAAPRPEADACWRDFYTKNPDLAHERVMVDLLQRGRDTRHEASQGVKDGYTPRARVGKCVYRRQVCRSCPGRTAGQGASGHICPARLGPTPCVCPSPRLGRTPV